jgi:lysozyme family protein
MKEDLIRYTITTWEGGYSEDENDPGGATKFGISQRAYPNLNIAALTLDEAVAIYIADYWSPLHLDELTSRRVQWKVFDIAVNQGVVRAALILQAALSVVEDGAIGTQTIAAANARDEVNLVMRLVAAQILRYVNLVKAKPQMLTFLLGWVKRALDMGENLPQVPA